MIDIALKFLKHPSDTQLMGALAMGQLADVIKKTVGFGAITLLFISIILLVGQEHFKFILQPLGLYIEQAGVFTDCSKAQNANHPYCAKKESESDRQWKLTRQKPGFNLTGFN